jgi:hypothetical protein
MPWLLSGFLNGLRKSFSGKDFLRDVYKCKVCNEPSFFGSCLKCETDDAYRRSNAKT